MQLKKRTATHVKKSSTRGKKQTIGQAESEQGYREFELVKEHMEKDFVSFRLLMLNRTASIIPQWTENNSSDLGITLVELLAWLADYLIYYQDAIATEVSMGTANNKIFVNKYARLFGSTIHQGCRFNGAEIAMKATVNTIDHNKDPNEDKVFIKERSFGAPFLDESDLASPLYVWLLSVHSYQL